MQLQIRKSDSRITGYCTEGSFIEDNEYWVLEVEEPPSDEEIYWMYYDNGNLRFDEELKKKEQQEAAEEEERQAQEVNFNEIIKVRTLAVMPDTEALNYKFLFNRWAADTKYNEGDRFTYNGKFYKVLQSHTSQSDWLPDTTPSLYVEIADPSIEWPDFVQPTGAHDSYNKGDKVTFNGNHYISLLDGNVWSPLDYPQGWEKQ